MQQGSAPGKVIGTFCLLSFFFFLIEKATLCMQRVNIQMAPKGLHNDKGVSGSPSSSSSSFQKWSVCIQATGQVCVSVPAHPFNGTSGNRSFMCPFPSLCISESLTTGDIRHVCTPFYSQVSYGLKIIQFSCKI